MKLRPLALTGTFVILWQYLVLSSASYAFLQPELGILFLIAGSSSRNVRELLLLGLLFGYTAEISGAIEDGGLLFGYVFAALVLHAVQRLKMESKIWKQATALAAGYGIFHVTLAAFYQPIVWRQWAGIVVAQLLAAAMIVIANQWAQRQWAPNRR